MSEKTPEGPDLDATTEQSVRRLLAEARHAEPLPPEVAARLDTLLGELVETRAAQTGVLSLAQRRRQRLGLFLAAAAAAVVVGVAGVALPQLSGSSEDSGAGSAADTTSEASSGAASGSDRGRAEGGAGAEDQPESQPGRGDDPGVAATAPQGRVVDAPPFVDGRVALLGVETLEADVAEVVGRAGAPVYSSKLSLTELTCPPAAYGEGRLVPALYDGAPVVLALRPASGGTRTGQVLACGTAAVLRSVSLPTS